MFDQLFGSKTRVKLLSLFLNNPGRSYYVREITRKIDEQINSVRRELSNLLSIGLIKSSTQNNRLYYEVNDKYVHYNELRRIFASIKVSKSKELKNTREEEDIAGKLRSAGTIELAFLTGTFVRDSHTKIDMFIVGDVNRAKAAKVIEEVEQELGRELNYTIMTPEDYGYRNDLNDRFLADLIESKKIVLVDQKRVLPESVKIPTQVEVEAVISESEPDAESELQPQDEVAPIEPVAEKVPTKTKLKVETK